MTQHDSVIKQLLLVVLLPIYLNDTLAYISGRLLGKHKMFPTVSPKKTWEGFAGGLLGAALVMIGLLAMNANSYTGKEQYFAIAFISVAASILATVGDLFESKLKRSAEVKDSGNILPGHGGVLDRIDAMIFTAPTLYVLITTIL
jgi:phosphatidate cytidylyltransferase